MHFFITPNRKAYLASRSTETVNMQDAKQKKGPLLHPKPTNHRTHTEKALVKDEVTFEKAKKSSQSNGKGRRCHCQLLEFQCSEHIIVKQFDSSKIESPFLTPSLLERKAAAKKAAD